MGCGNSKIGPGDVVKQRTLFDRSFHGDSKADTPVVHPSALTAAQASYDLLPKNGEEKYLRESATTSIASSQSTQSLKSSKKSLFSIVQQDSWYYAPRPVLRIDTR